MQVLCVTGGIGSGKSHIIKIFSSLGIPAYYSDERTKFLYSSSPSLLLMLKQLLGDDIVDKRGKLDRKVMASKIFSDKSLLKKMEEVVHPVVMSDFLSWKNDFDKKGTPFVIIESAIFLENPLLRRYADKVLTVSSPMELRLERIQQRDSCSMEQIKERISNQWTDVQREKEADFIIVSDGKTALLPQVLE